jgi:hypothetical protein
MKKPTEAERELLDLVLREVRHAVATREQVCVHVDPWTSGGGLNVFVNYNAPGLSYEIAGELTARRVRGRTPLR